MPRRANNPTSEFGVGSPVCSGVKCKPSKHELEIEEYFANGFSVGNGKAAFHVREQLKELGCKWDAERRLWLAPNAELTVVAKRAIAEFLVWFVKAVECSEETLHQLNGSRAVKSVLSNGDWWRIECTTVRHHELIGEWFERRKIRPYVSIEKEETHVS